MTDDPTDLELPADLRAALDALPREIEPDSDLWEGVRARIEPRLPRHEPARPRVAGLLLALAAGALLALGFGALSSGTRPEPPPPADPVAGWEREIRRTTEELLVEVSDRRAALDPAEQAVIDRALADLDDAIAEVRAALAADPHNDALESALAHAWQRKVQLLRSAVDLPCARCEPGSGVGG